MNPWGGSEWSILITNNRERRKKKNTRKINDKAKRNACSACRGSNRSRQIQRWSQAGTHLVQADHLLWVLSNYLEKKNITHYTRHTHPNLGESNIPQIPPSIGKARNVASRAVAKAYINTYLTRYLSTKHRPLKNKCEKIHEKRKRRRNACWGSNSRPQTQRCTQTKLFGPAACFFFRAKKHQIAPGTFTRDIRNTERNEEGL